MKRMLLLLVLVSGLGFALPTKADASKTIVGRILTSKQVKALICDSEHGVGPRDAQ